MLTRLLGPVIRRGGAFAARALLLSSPPAVHVNISVTAVTLHCAYSTPRFWKSSTDGTDSQAPVKYFFLMTSLVDTFY